MRSFGRNIRHFITGFRRPRTRSDVMLEILKVADEEKRHNDYGLTTPMSGSSMATYKGLKRAALYLRAFSWLTLRPVRNWWYKILVNRSLKG